MSEVVNSVKITGWSYRGLNVPDYDINLADPDSNRNFSLILQLSGQGKTTTLNLLRYSFYNFLDDIDSIQKRREAFDALNNKENPSKNGKFTLYLKINNQINYKITLNFDFKNYSIEYFTSAGDGVGDEPGLNLPESLKDHISSEFIKKSFFNLELADELFDEQEKETDKTIINICKLYFLDRISSSFDRYKKNFETKTGNSNVSNEEILQLKHARDKIEEQLEYIIKKEEEFLEKRKKLKHELNSLVSEEKKIRQNNAQIDEKLTAAEEEIKQCEVSLSDSFSNCYNYLKNPMKFSEYYFNSLNNFEKNLTKMGIPKSVGESFFSELIESEECLCGYKMNEDMRKNIDKNKFRFLTDETYNVLNPIKVKITQTSSVQKENYDEEFNLLTKKMGNLRKAQTKLTKVKNNLDQERLIEINKLKLEKQREIEPINEFLDNIINQRWKDTDTPATESKKSLQKQLENIRNKIEEATGTVKLGKQIVLIKKYLSEIKKDSLDEISNNIIERINEEVPRVLKYEPIYVKSIKDKIVFKDRSGASQGQKVRITYLFLIALLNRSSLKFPFIVDSPATAIDDLSKEEVAKSLANYIESQYIGFLLTPERDDFADVLDEELKKNINLIVAFPKNKLTENLISQAKDFPANTEIDKWSNGIISYNRDFFYSFRGRSILK